MGNGPMDGGDLRNYKAALEEVAAVSVTDLQGVFTSVNSKFCLLTGYSEQELLGKTHRILNSGYHTKAFYQNLWDTIRSGGTWRGEIRNLHQSGRAYWSQMTIIPFCDRSGSPYQYLSVRSDMSALKEAELERVRLVDIQKELNRAEEAILSRDRFVSMASHELKTPITALQLRIQVRLKKLKADPAGQTPAEQSGILETLLLQVQRLNHMVDDMLDVSRISAGRLELKYERINLVRVVDEILAQYHDDFVREKVEVGFFSPEFIWGNWDRARIEQILINLLTNALKYGAGKPISVTLEEKSGQAVVRVKDQGIGMSETFQKQVFSRFAREHEAGDIHGNGLGLWITSRIVKAHGGEITVASEFGKGSEFIVELPLSTDHSGALTL